MDARLRVGARNDGVLRCEEAQIRLRVGARNDRTSPSF